MDLIPPDKLAEAVDAYKGLCDFRLAEQKIVDGYKNQETFLKHQLMQSIEAAKMSACGGSTHTAAIVHKIEPSLDDPEALEEHIKATGEFDLLQRRVSSQAIRLRWDQGLEVPGVGRIETTALSVTKNR